MDKLLASGRFSTWPSHGKDKESLTFSSFAPDRTIDWILIPTNWTALSSQVPATMLSDHLPVVMEIRQQ
jgi:endonuclease/exonuclease/phosphatase family metal-dependent hydrolase